MPEEKKKSYKDSKSKKEWDSKNMVFTAFKMFRATSKSQNDQELIDFLSNQQSKSDTIKQALREYMERHREEQTQ